MMKQEYKDIPNPEPHIENHTHGQEVHYIIGPYRNKESDFYHRTDGPAYIFYNNVGEVVMYTYSINDKLHCEDGPALYLKNHDGTATYEYWLNGHKLKPETFVVRRLNEILKPHDICVEKIKTGPFKNTYSIRTFYDDVHISQGIPFENLESEINDRIISI